MLLQHRSLPLLTMRPPIQYRGQDGITLPAPRQNKLLAALPHEDCQRLLPHLEPVLLPAGSMVFRAGGPERYIYFVTSGVVSRRYVMENGATAEFAVTGNEGAIGIATFLGGEAMPGETLVLSATHAYRMRSDVLQTEFSNFGTLSRVLLRYTMGLIVQIGQTAACNRHHSLEQRLCCLILSCLDRLRANELAMTHELIADVLGVRREGVTEAAGRLQAAGMVHCYRGHLAVLDCRRLEAEACECYRVVKREYDRLPPPENPVGRVARQSLTAAA